MKKLLAFLFAFSILISGCSSGKTESTTREATEAAKTTTEAVTAEPKETEALHKNERGPFDAEHYEIGMKALNAIDKYLDGGEYLSVTSMLLKQYNDEMNKLPELSESDPLCAGNEFVKAYVFLASTDFAFQLSDFETKKYEDRNYLAAALGEPERDFESEKPQMNVDRVKDFLDDFVKTMNDKYPENTYSYSVTDDGIFVQMNLPSFDYYYLNKDTISAEEKETVKSVSQGYVSGDFGESLVNALRDNGAADAYIYLILCGTYGDYCCSRDLQIFIDNLN